MAERQTPTPRRSGDSGERRQTSTRSSAGERRQESTPRGYGERRPETPRRQDPPRRQEQPSRSDRGERRPAAAARSGSGERRQQAPSRRNEVIRCENCGEDYSITYKRCPFCDERPGRGGVVGRRVANTRGGGYGRPVNPIQVAGVVISLILIASALFIVLRFLGAPIFGGKPGGENSGSNPGGSSTSQSSGSSSNTPLPSVQSIALNTTEVTLEPGGTYQLAANLLPAGVTGDVTWSSSNESAATVDAAGLVTNVNAGTAAAEVTITAACGDVTAQATVYCKAASSTTVPSGTRGTVVNASTGLYVRSGPGKTYDKVASILNGSKVTIVGEEDGWYKIIYTGNKTGYVSKDYISLG